MILCDGWAHSWEQLQELLATVCVPAKEGSARVCCHRQLGICGVARVKQRDSSWLQRASHVGKPVAQGVAPAESTHPYSQPPLAVASKLL